MASAQGNGVLVVTQYIPAVNGHPFQQNTPSGQNTGWLQRFIKGEPKALGVVQIMIGIIHICLGAALCSVQFVPIAVMSGLVFWAPLFYFISGGLSISAENNRNRGKVKDALGMNTVSTIVTSIAVIIYIIDLCGPFYHSNRCNGFDTSYMHSSNGWECTRNYYAAQALRYRILGVLLILSLLEFAISISTSAFGCKSVCRRSGYQEGQPMFAVPNAYPQDPMFQGMPLMGPGMTMAQGTPMVQAMPMSYIGMMTPGIAPAPGVASEPLPTTETPPSYYKSVPGDTP